jgi:hypothetical protein
MSSFLESPVSAHVSPQLCLLRSYISRIVMVVVAFLLLVSCGGHQSALGTSNSWAVDTSSTIWTISFGSGQSFPQYGALDTASGYLRLVPTTQSNWGTSVVIFPAFWSGGVYYQGTRIAASHSLSGNNLVINFTGILGGLTVVGRLTIFPPDQQIKAQVDILSATGDLVLDNRPGEAFKLVMLSSMHINDTQWDAKAAYVGSQSYTLQASGWVIDPPGSGTIFGLTGGTSSWKTNAPTIEVTFPASHAVTGWVTTSSDPNDDNVGFWAASDAVVGSYSYNVTAK